MSEKEPKRNGGQGDSWGKNAMIIGGLVLIGGSFIRAAYDRGVDMSRKILKRHDKDVRRLEKKTRKEAKDKLKEEKRRQKEQIREEQTKIVDILFNKKGS